MVRIVSFVLAAAFGIALSRAAYSEPRPQHRVPPAHRTASATYTILYGFRGRKHHDGRHPDAALLVSASGTLYGTTELGGNAQCIYGNGCGTVFRLEPSTSGGYTEKVIHEFSSADGGGSLPTANPIVDSAGVLYGTAGNRGGVGTAYALTPGSSGYSYRVLFAFEGGAGGGGSLGPLLFGKHGELYGTTFEGGNTGGNCRASVGCGVVFELVPHGSTYSETVIYSFTGGNDGANPMTGLTAGKNGVLYGTTYGGGGAGSFGTVFSLVPNGSTFQEHVLYRFSGGSDGGNPSGPVMLGGGGSLFGTMGFGVYELTPSGSKYAERAIALMTDRYRPAAPTGPLVIDAAGNIYGTASDGLNVGHCLARCGAVFELERSGTSYNLVVLHAFLGNHKGDGGNAHGGLVAGPNGTMFGTTYNGGPAGCGNKGCGSVFSVTPPVL